MEFRLTKSQLIKSAFYCAAGIDLQPIVRFGDIIDDFIYVTVGLSKEELISGIESFINDLSEDLDNLNSSLKLLSITDIKNEEIEHPKHNRLVSELPDYFTPEVFGMYQNAVRPFINRQDDYYLEFKLLLKIGHIERQIRLFHLTGEALATYDVIYRKQNIAPKLFISIQTGLIEIPEILSNRMFELSSAKPKIWLRGVWAKRQKDLNGYKPDIFNPKGIFNEEIGEYRRWKVISNPEINSLLDDAKTYRLVKSYGIKVDWLNIGTVEIKSNGILVTKRFEKYNSNLASNYHFNEIHFPLSRLFELYEKVKDYSNENPNVKEIRIAILPFGYESFEIMLSEFIDKYKMSTSFNLIIDVFYINKSDINRFF
jgi:hypothetical protein